MVTQNTLRARKVQQVFKIGFVTALDLIKYQRLLLISALIFGRPTNMSTTRAIYVNNSGGSRRKAKENGTKSFSANHVQTFSFVGEAAKKLFLVARPLPPPPLSGRATKKRTFFAASLTKL